MPRRCTDDYQRFLTKVVHNPRTDCWEWSGAKTHGYAVMGIRDQVVRLNRWILERSLGRPLRPQHLACHTCDNRGCVNPEHLYEGDHAANSRDAVARDRVAWGSRAPSSKLTDADVLSILREAQGGMSQATLAKRHDINQSTVSRIVARRYWKRLEVPSATA